MAAPTLSANARMQIYLIGTAYVADASTDLTTNLVRWIKDGSQAGASTMTSTQRLLKLLSNAAAK